MSSESTVVAVDLDELVVTRGGKQRRTRIHTVAQAADFVGIQPGAPEQVYRPATLLRPDAVLQIDREAARLLADWYQLGEHALAAFATAVPTTNRPRRSCGQSISIWPLSPRESITVPPQAMRRSANLTCTSARSTARRRAAISSGMPRSGQCSGTARWLPSRTPSLSSTPGATVFAHVRLTELAVSRGSDLATPFPARCSIMTSLPRVRAR